MALVALSAWCSAIASAALPCVGADMYVVAHQDDTLLFQSPDLLEDVRGNRCIRTVFTTAGDAGKAASYWEGREDGAEAAYAQMAGVADVWQATTVDLAGHPVLMRTLVGRPGISILYLRLPDGRPDGVGFPMYGSESLRKLWNGGNGMTPAISTIEADDDSTQYTYAGLIEALSDAIESFGARRILTQNYAPLNGEDHSDHLNTARFVRAAAQALPGAYGGWRLVGYQGYETGKLPANLGGELLAGKEAAFETYVPHDSGCVGICGAPPYTEWRHRQYVAPSETRGVVADAGLEQIVGAGAPVALDGGESSAESGGPLGYSWTQVGGPAVALEGAATATPALVMPPHPTVLTFALTVNQGVITSAPDLVRVRVPGGSPVPTAIAGDDRIVAAGERVNLDGGASWDPEGLPLSYSWTQVGGPAVNLEGAETGAPSFTAPSGPASLTFSLVVSNGTQTSEPASVGIEVAAAPSPPPPPPPPNGQPPPGGATPEKPRNGNPKGDQPPGTETASLSRRAVQLTVGRRAKRVIVVNGGGLPQSCRGRLPVGALCRINPAGHVVVEARRSLSRAGSFRVTVRFAAGTLPAQRHLKVVIKPAKN